MNKKPFYRAAIILTAVALVTVSLFASCGAPARVAARGFLRKGETPGPNFGAYGYVAFTKMPGQSDSLRYVRVCEAYRQVLPVAEEFKNHPPGEIMITYWPLTTDYFEPRQVDDCAFCISNYAYTLGYEIAISVDKATAKGPLLVAWDKPFGSDTDNAQAIVIDLSMFPDDELERAFLIWRDRITRDPETWRKGLNLVLFREAFRNAILKYGDSIVSALKL